MQIDADISFRFIPHLQCLVEQTCPGVAILLCKVLAGLTLALQPQV